MITIAQVCKALEAWAPLPYQESYDNCGLLLGSGSTTVTGILCTLDCTEAVIEEAIAKQCNLIIAHHPIVFSGLKRLNGSNYVERTVMLALQNNIAIYAIHTNADNVITGVNAKLAAKLGLENITVLAPKAGLLAKFITYVPDSHAEQVRTAIWQAGGGNIGNYSECSFSFVGNGTFKGNEHSNPQLGYKGERTNAAEQRIEVIIPVHLQNKVLAAVRAAHLYEEVAYEVIPLANVHQSVGSGMVGSWQKPKTAVEALAWIKNVLQVPVVRHTKIVRENIQKVAICGGAGSFLTKRAIGAGADLYVTADVKYHEFFDADDQIIIADVGHFESEQFTSELLFEVLRANFPTFAAIFSSVTGTNPVHYF
jgi:dinuclear metal center YbgI/SA1388 family protein